MDQDERLWTVWHGEPLAGALPIHPVVLAPGESVEFTLEGSAPWEEEREEEREDDRDPFETAAELGLDSEDF